MSVKVGDTVTVNYVLMTIDGEKIESNPLEEPITFKVGDGDIIKGVDEEIIGMVVGDAKEFTIDPSRGFGEYVEARVQTVPRSDDETTPVNQGDIVDVETTEGQLIKAVVKEAGDDYLVIDLNHPLAGMTLKFQLELLSMD